MYYDVVIVGAGIAGLRTGIWLLEHGIRCVILEKYNYIGGRIVTYHKSIPGVGKVRWENGAGRISTRHTKVLGLLKHYGLHTYPISGESGYMNEPGVLQPNRFSALCSIFLDPLRQLPADVLQTHTLRQVSEMVFGSAKTREFYSQFPYFSEVHTARADSALLAFSNEMSSMDGFVGCAEGMSALIDGMVAEFKKLGGVIELNQEVVSVLSPVVRCKNGVFFAPVCVMALHSEAMKQIHGVSHLPVLQKLVMNPLLRMYAVFPVKKGKAWFADFPKIVTDDRIRFIIPISERTIMISYTDGNDARFWMREDPKEVEKIVMRHIRSLFPNCDVPDPIFFKTHPWTYGCTYWKPGRYDVIEESRRSIHPDPSGMPGLFVCGESFSVEPCWIESAIDQADQMLGSAAWKAAVRALKS